MLFHSRSLRKTERKSFSPKQLQLRSSRRHGTVRRRIALGLLGLALPQLPACVEKVSQTATYNELDGSSDNGKVIPTAKPSRDAAADKDSEERLAEVQWGVIERKGPRPIWEQVSDHRDRERQSGQATRPLGSNHDKALATTRPTTLPTGTTEAMLTTRPYLPVINEDGLPVKIVELPDGKLRIIWNLRSYGGSTVTTVRDMATARRTLTVTAADLAPLVAMLTQQVGPTGSVVPLPRENTVVITCDKAMKPSVIEVLARLDIPPRQVEISAKIFEVSQDFDFQQGARVLANHLGADNSQTGISTFDTQRLLDQTASSAGTPFQGSVLSLMKNFQSAGISVEASFQILANAGLIRVVSSPRMTVAAGQTGYMLAGQELPIQSANLVNGILTTATQYKPVGVQLYITPQAVGPDRIKLHAISIVSSVSGFTPVPALNGNNPTQFLINPVIDSREAETAVTIDNGDTLVISGLRMIRTTTRENKVPGLGDIPILGWLFKNHRSQQQMTDLYFFVTPTLL